MTRKLLCAAMAAMLYAPSAAAQNRGIFIQAGPLFDGLFTTTSEAVPAAVGRSSSLAYSWFDLNGDRRWQPGEEGAPIAGGLPVIDLARSLERRFVPGVSAAIGVFVTPSVSVRLEGSFQQDHVFTTETTLLTLFTPNASRQAITNTDILVSAAWHQGESRRVSVAYLAGMVFRRQHHDTTLTFQYSILPPSGGRPFTVSDEQHFESTMYDVGIAAGVDVPINISRSVALVPQFRLVAANHEWHVRPAVTLRWRP
jgi:hypothetical protein